MSLPITNIYRRLLQKRNRRRFCVKNLSRTAYKAIGVTVGVNGFSLISKSGEKTRKSPEIVRFRELFLAEKERFEFRKVDFNPSYPFYMFVQLRF